MRSTGRSTNVTRRSEETTPCPYQPGRCSRPAGMLKVWYGQDTRVNRPCFPRAPPGPVGGALRTLYVSLVDSGARLPMCPNCHVPKAETTQFLVTL